ncbi:MAG TPA: DUF3137 domain-containing protein [Gemmatimonadaceae bacterium]
MSQSSSTTVGRLSTLDGAARAKLASACDYINAEVAKVRSRIFTVGAVCAALAAVVYAIMWANGVRDPRFPLFGAGIVVFLFATHQWRALNKTYKQIVVSRVVTALGHGMTYSPESSFTKEDFLRMDLFAQRTERWSAEDEVRGRKNAVTYSILEGKATRTEGSGKNRRTVVIFRGSIARLDFNKNFAGHTVVVPDGESKILGGLFGEASSRRQKDLCRLESVEFEAEYSVYSTDQQEARYILTPKMMELILGAAAAYPGVRMSFNDNSVFVTIPTSENRFEVGGLFGSRITPEIACGELAEVVHLAERLIDTLDLETRIWSRV